MSAKHRLGRRPMFGGIAALAFGSDVTVALAQTASLSVPVFYRSGELRIAAYLSRPAGEGPFPLVIFNHGSRAGAERQPRPFQYMAELYVAAGYAVLVPERRGYGASDGAVFADEVGGDVGALFLRRMEAETDDVLAALPYVATLPFVDARRIAITGWSFGGIVTMLAIRRSTAFLAAIDEAGGALSWRRSPALRQALIGAARAAAVPILFLDAENDATTEAVTALADARVALGLPGEIRIYPAFTPTRNPGRIAPGHLIFSGEGVGIWGADATGFLGRFV